MARAILKFGVAKRDTLHKIAPTIARPFGRLFCSQKNTANVIVSVSTDFHRFRATLDRLGREQLPYAAALALNQTARTAREDVTRELPAIFSAKGRPPTPFTMRAIGTAPARKTSLAARVFVKRLQARYLEIEETGGIRVREPGAPVLTPVDVRVNRYGNIPRALIRRLAADPQRYFLGRIDGIYGLWERLAAPSRRGGRRAGGVRLLVAFREQATYRPRFHFGEHVAASVRRHFLPALQAGMRQAIATAIRG